MSIWNVAMFVDDFGVEFVSVLESSRNDCELSMEVGVVIDEVIKFVGSKSKIRDGKVWLFYGHVG